MSERIRLNNAWRRVKRLKGVLGYSLNHLAFEASEEAQALGRRGYVAKFITLTYRNGDDWRPGHIGDFTRALRRWFARHGEVFRMGWVSELQQRGAVHYHAVIFVPRSMFLPCPDRCGWWPHGMSNVQTARNPVGYLTKYASKATEADALSFPKGARMHGVCGLSKERRRWQRTYLAARWVRRVFVDALGSLRDVDLVKVGGGWVDRASGLFVRSPWRFELDQGGGTWVVSAA